MLIYNLPTIKAKNTNKPKKLFDLKVFKQLSGLLMSNFLICKKNICKNTISENI